MNQLSSLTEVDLGSVRGGTGEAGDDSLARDLGQFVGGVYGYMVSHPFLTFTPLGPMLANLAGFRAMTH